MIDLDAVCHSLLKDKTGRVFRDVLARFGSGILDKTGSIDRARLASLVFTEEAGPRRDLEAILHPAARTVVIAISSHMASPYHVVCVPLLAEAGNRENYDKVLVVHSPVAQRVRRISKRWGVTRPQIDKIIQLQATDEERQALADDEVDNSSDLESLRRRLIDLHDRYLSWAASNS